jgi:hypothetical protein
MINRIEFNEACAEALEMIEAAGICLTEADKEKITAADFGLIRDGFLRVSLPYACLTVV